MGVTTPDVIVVGAGFAGAVFARVMATAGKKVLVIERRPTAGGNMADKIIDGIVVHAYGPHIFHTNNKKVFDFLKKFSKWFPYQHRVAAKIEGKLIPVPFNFTSIEKLFDERAAQNLKTKLVSAFGNNASVPVFELLHHDDDDIRNLGRYIYEKVFAGYTAKQWGVPIGQVDTTTISRVPVRIGYDDKYFTDCIQMMPRRGYTHLFTEMLSHKNITTALNTDAKACLRFDFAHKKIFFDGVPFNGIVFWTGAVDELMNYRYGQLPYRSLNLVFETHESEWYQPNAVVNYPGEEAWTRISEFKHFTSPENSKTKHTVVLKEYPVPYTPEDGREPFYPVINEDNRKLYEQYERDLRVFTNLRLCGRLAEYKYYNMDDVAARALEIAEEINMNTNRCLPLSLIKEVLVYGIIGSCCAVLDSIVFMLLRKTGLNLYAANFVSINTGIFSSFLLNTFVNFKVKDKLPQRGIKFFAVGYTGLVLSMIIMHTGVKILHVGELAVKLFSVVIVAAVQFTLNKLITFKKEHP